VFRIPCPHCGPRNRTEFRHVGERKSRPDLYGQRNLADWTAETWYHTAGCRRFVTVERHTMSNEIRPSEGPAAGTTEATHVDPGRP